MDFMLGENRLNAPSDFWKLTPAQLSDISNGCGPKGFGWLVPDRFRLIGVNFTPACDIHDFCYHLGIPKEEADRMFLSNLLTIAEKEAVFGFKILASHFAFIYYLAVKNGGAGSYNRSNEKEE